VTNRHKQVPADKRRHCATVHIAWRLMRTPIELLCYLYLVVSIIDLWLFASHADQVLDSRFPGLTDPGRNMKGE